MSRHKLWIGLIVLFCAGILTGSGGTALYWTYDQGQQSEGGPAAKQERVMKRLIHELSLDSSQQAAIKPVVERAYTDLLRLRFRHQPEVEQILAQAMADMKTALSSEQQAKLDGLYARLQGRWNQSRKFVSTVDGGPGPAGPP